MSLLKIKLLKNRLRQVKNSFNDVIDSMKHDVASFSGKFSKSSSTTSSLSVDEPVLSESEIKEKYDEIISKNRLLLDLNSFKDDAPLVSIIISCRNGLSDLKRLFKDFKENTEYNSYEIIVIDNKSNKDSISFLEELKKTLPLKIIKNTENHSYAKSINNAVNNTKGEYILLLKDNMEPLYGWLNQMVQTVLKSDDLGAVGAKLLYPDCSDSIYNKNKSYKIKHMGITFKNEPNGSIVPYNMGEGLEPFDNKSKTEEFRIAVSGDALLVHKEKYLQVKGLDERYTNGYEDIDLCLKLYKNGYKNIYSPKTILIQHECT